MSPDLAPSAGLLSVEDLEVTYRAAGLRGMLHRDGMRAVNHVSFDVRPAETLALVGESGSGKPTIARAVQGLVRPSAGRVSLLGENITGPVQRRSLDANRRIQLVFQNPD